MPKVIIALPDKGVAEVGAAIGILHAAQTEQRVFGPRLEIRRGGVHNYLRILACLRLVAVGSVEDIIEFVCLVIYDTSCTESSVLLGSAAGGQHLAKRSVVGGVCGLQPPERVICACHVRTVLLQIKHFEITVHGIIERHRVAYIP